MKKEILCNDYEVKNGKALVFEINGKDHNVTVKDLETDGAEFRIEQQELSIVRPNFSTLENT